MNIILYHPNLGPCSNKWLFEIILILLNRSGEVIFDHYEIH